MLFDGNQDNGQINEYDKKFNEVIDELEKKHIIFHLGDELIIEEAKVEGNKFIVGNQEYTTVVLPPHLVLLDTTKELLVEFKKNGGIVAEDISGIKADNIIDDERIVYTKRVFEDFDLYYFVNTSDERVNAEIGKGTHTLDIVTCEKNPFNSNNLFEPSGSLVVLDYRDTVQTVRHNTECTQIDISGDWNIENCDYNAITLDKCRYSFDGEVIEENGPVISIQDKACALVRKVRIDMEYTVRADYIPNEVFLVCETPEIFEISVNGIEIKKNVCGYYRDKTFKKLDLSGLLKSGENIILVSCDFEQSGKTYENLRKAKIFESELNKLTYDMEIENMYIIGDFSVKTEGEFENLTRNAVRYSKGFVISNPKQAVEAVFS